MDLTPIPGFNPSFILVASSALELGQGANVGCKCSQSCRKGSPKCRKRACTPVCPKPRTVRPLPLGSFTWPEGQGCCRMRMSRDGWWKAIQPSAFWPGPLGASDRGAGRGWGQSWELGLVLSSCLALSTYHAKAIPLLPRREKCGARQRNLTAVWKSGEGHCLLLIPPLSIPLPLQ